MEESAEGLKKQKTVGAQKKGHKDLQLSHGVLNTKKRKLPPLALTRMVHGNKPHDCKEGIRRRPYLVLRKQAHPCYKLPYVTIDHYKFPDRDSALAWCTYNLTNELWDLGGEMTEEEVPDPENLEEWIRETIFSDECMGNEPLSYSLFPLYDNLFSTTLEKEPDQKSKRISPEMQTTSDNNEGKSQKTEESHSTASGSKKIESNKGSERESSRVSAEDIDSDSDTDQENPRDKSEVLIEETYNISEYAREIIAQWKSNIRNFGER
jgi:hypothetical protein